MFKQDLDVSIADHVPRPNFQQDIQFPHFSLTDNVDTVVPVIFKEDLMPDHKNQVVVHNYTEYKPKLFTEMGLRNFGRVGSLAAVVPKIPDDWHFYTFDDMQIIYCNTPLTIETMTI